jgi:cytochrome b6-f complex iron-sulfur subunit
VDHDIEGRECEISQRHLLAATVRAGMVLVAGAAAGPGEAAQWVAVGDARDFRQGVPKRVVLPNGRAVFVVRTGPKQVRALSALCTHAGVEIRWDSRQRRFTCPAHSAAFAIDGAVTRGPARTRLPLLASSQQGAAVRVDASGGAANRRARRGTGDSEHERGEREHERERRREHGRDDD